MKLSHEIVEKAKAAESAEELLAIAKANGVEMTTLLSALAIRFK